MTLSMLRRLALAWMIVLLVGAAPLAQTPEPAQDDSIEAIGTRFNAGDADAQNTIGGMYRTGRGVPQDAVKAYNWFNLATTYADASIQETSAKQRDSVAERLTPEQRAEGQRLSREWFAAHPQQEPSPAEVADVRARAYPWSRLMLARRSIPADLNVQLPHRVSGLLVWVVIFGAVALPLSAARVWQVVFSLTAGAGAVSIIWLNWRFYRFLTTCREPWFTVRAVWIHLLYYAYSSATFGWAWVRHRVASVFDDLRLRPVSRARPHP